MNSTMEMWPEGATGDHTWIEVSPLPLPGRYKFV